MYKININAINVALNKFMGPVSPKLATKKLHIILQKEQHVDGDLSDYNVG